MIIDMVNAHSISVLAGPAWVAGPKISASSEYEA